MSTREAIAAKGVTLKKITMDSFFPVAGRAEFHPGVDPRSWESAFLGRVQWPSGKRAVW